MGTQVDRASGVPSLPPPSMEKWDASKDAGEIAQEAVASRYAQVRAPAALPLAQAWALMMLCLPQADPAPPALGDIAVPEAVGRDNRRRMAFDLGVQAARELGLDPARREPAELIALGEQMVLDYLMAPASQGVWLWMQLARMEGRLDAAADETDPGRMADRVIAFIEQAFKDDIAVDQALADLAALEMPVREDIARTLLVDAGLDPERRVGMPKAGHPLHPWMLRAPRKASSYYFNRDALTAEDLALMTDGPMTAEHATAILARLPPSLEGAFAARFDDYASKAASIMTGLMDTWVTSAAGRQGMILDANATVIVSRAHLRYYQIERGLVRRPGIRHSGKPQVDLQAEGYFVTVQTARGAQRLFLNTGNGMAWSLPAHGTLGAWIKEHRLGVFDPASVQAADQAELTASQVVLDVVASGRHADLARWLEPAFRADIERARESARGQTTRESMVDTLLDFIPFRAMIVAIQKGDAQKAIVSGWLDMLSLVPLLGLGGRVASAAARPAVPFARIALAHMPLVRMAATRAAWSAGRSFALRAAGLRTGLRTAFTSGGARAWARLRPLDAERVAAALHARHPGLADHLLRISRTARGPVVAEGWWRVPSGHAPTPAGGISALAPVEAFGPYGGMLEVLPYGSRGGAYTRISHVRGERVGALLLADDEGWLYPSLPIPTLERYRAGDPAVLRALATRRPGGDATLALDGRHYARIDDAYVEVIQDAALSTPLRTIWRVLPPERVTPDMVVHRLVYDPLKRLWRAADMPGLRGGGLIASRAASVSVPPSDINEVLVAAIRGKPTVAQRDGLRTLLARVGADPKGEAILRAMQAHYELLGEAPDILLRTGAVRPPGPATDLNLGEVRWDLDLSASLAGSPDAAIRDLARIYNEMTGLLTGGDPYGAMLGRGKPPLDPRLQRSWKAWVEEARHSDPSEGLRRQRLLDMRLDPMLREMRCHGGLYKSALQYVVMSVLHPHPAAAVANVERRIDLPHLDVYSVPPLPDDVETLSLVGSRIRDWRNLPRGVTALDLRECGLRRIPADLPVGLEHLDVSGNLISRLEVSTLTQLRELKVAANLLTELPLALPAGLQRLDVSRNRVTALAPLPATLRVLAVDRNQLLELPTVLPADLQWISAAGNRLYRLPEELPIGLRMLDLRHNGLVRLPDGIRALTDCVVKVQHNPIPLHEIPLFPSDQPGPLVEFSFNDNAAGTSRVSLAQAVKRWLGDGAQDAITRWETIADGLDGTQQASAFANFLERLHGAMEAGGASMRAPVRDWLVELSRPERTALRRATLGVCLDGAESCLDRVAWTLNQARALHLNDDIQQGLYDDRPALVVDAARQMFRLEALSQIARRKVGTLLGPDETEVYLAYAVSLKEKLDLTAVAPVMHYFPVARVTAQDLDDALREVRARERSEFAHYLAIDYAPWRTLLQRKLGGRYDAALTRMHELVEQRLEADIDAELAKIGVDTGDAEARKDLGMRLTRVLQYRVLGPLTRDYLRAVALETAAHAMDDVLS